jgi:hypothetical protein
VKGNGTSNSVPCVKCSNLKYCEILNQLIIQEVYYPNNLELRGTCSVIEQLAENMYSEIFGLGRTFRDTAQCRGALCYLYLLLIIIKFYL